jgi:hypothetical protein
VLQTWEHDNYSNGHYCVLTDDLIREACVRACEREPIGSIAVETRIYVLVLVSMFARSCSTGGLGGMQRLGVVVNHYQ